MFNFFSGECSGKPLLPFPPLFDLSGLRIVTYAGPCSVTIVSVPVLSERRIHVILCGPGWRLPPRFILTSVDSREVGQGHFYGTQRLLATRQGVFFRCDCVPRIRSYSPLRGTRSFFAVDYYFLIIPGLSPFRFIPAELFPVRPIAWASSDRKIVGSPWVTVSALGPVHTTGSLPSFYPCLRKCDGLYSVRST